MKGLFAAALGWTLWPLVALADITGTASVIDGDTIEIQGRTIGLFGIDEQERAQKCRADRKTWDCGVVAAKVLRDLVAGETVRCDGPLDHDRYGRALAVCHVGGFDLNELMVRLGFARAYTHYSWDYIDAEWAARDDKIGMWRGSFVPPWDWRQGVRLPGLGDGYIGGNRGKCPCGLPHQSED